MRLYRYTAVLVSEKEGKDIYYNVQVPALPEIATFGESPEEAEFMAQDAIELVVSSRLEEGEDLPVNKKPTRLPKGAIVKDILVA